MILLGFKVHKLKWKTMQALLYDNFNLDIFFFRKIGYVTVRRVQENIFFLCILLWKWDLLWPFFDSQHLTKAFNKILKPKTQWKGGNYTRYISLHKKHLHKKWTIKTNKLHIHVDHISDQNSPPFLSFAYLSLTLFAAGLKIYVKWWLVCSPPPPSKHQNTKFEPPHLK